MLGSRIHGTDKLIYKVFCDDYVFRIPRYQRPYAWTTEHAEELLNDLLYFVEDSPKPVEEVDPYFLGSIVLVKDDNKPESEVIDGQQRVTTLTILFSVIRSLMRELDKEYANDLTGCINQEGNLILGIPDRPRLILRERDQDFFETNIQQPEDLSKVKGMKTEGLTDARRNIVENTNALIKILSDKPEAELKRLTEYILKRCYLVIVSTPNLEQAYRIFSVLNDRGLELSYTDILKAEIIGEIEDASQDLYSNKWEDIEEYLGREEFQDLFTHIRTIFRKVKAKRTILEEIRTYVNPADKPKVFIDEVLEPYADAFDVIINESYKGTDCVDEVNHHLKWLNWIDNFDWIPPAVLYVSQKGNDPESLYMFYKKLERLASGMMIYRADINKRIERYAKVLEEIEKGKNLFRDNSPLELSNEEKDKIVSKLNGDLYLETRTRKYVLLRLDSELSEGEAIYKHNIITIEHVLPQTVDADSTWAKWFPTKEIKEEHTHKLGNLVLLSRRKNSQAWKFDFDYKKENYFSTEKGVSSFALTTQVLREEKWTPEVLENRQKENIKILKRIWDL